MKVCFDSFIFIFELPDVCLLIIIHVKEQYAKGQNINPLMLLTEQNRRIAHIYNSSRSMNIFCAHKNAHYPTQHDPVLHLYGLLKRRSIERDVCCLLRK